MVLLQEVLLAVDADREVAFLAYGDEEAVELDCLFVGGHHFGEVVDDGYVVVRIEGVLGMLPEAVEPDEGEVVVFHFSVVFLVRVQSSVFSAGFGLPMYR